MGCFLCIDGVRHSHLTCQIASLYTNTDRLKLSPLCVCDSCAKVAQLKRLVGVRVCVCAFKCKDIWEAFIHCGPRFANILQMTEWALSSVYQRKSLLLLRVKSNPGSLILLLQTETERETYEWQQRREEVATLNRRYLQDIKRGNEKQMTHNRNKQMHLQQFYICSTV